MQITDKDALTRRRLFWQTVFLISSTLLAGSFIGYFLFMWLEHQLKKLGIPADMSLMQKLLSWLAGVMLFLTALSGLRVSRLTREEQLYIPESEG